MIRNGKQRAPAHPECPAPAPRPGQDAHLVKWLTPRREPPATLPVDLGEVLAEARVELPRAPKPQTGRVLGLIDWTDHLELDVTAEPEMPAPDHRLRSLWAQHEKEERELSRIASDAASRASFVSREGVLGQVRTPGVRQAVIVKRYPQHSTIKVR